MLRSDPVMDKTDLSLLLSALAVILALGATTGIALTIVVTYLVTKCLN